MVDRESRRREGTGLAETLAGLTRHEALGRIADAGFDAVTIRAGEWVQGDDAFNRIRIWIDEADRVVRARAE